MSTSLRSMDEYADGNTFYISFIPVHQNNPARGSAPASADDLQVGTDWACAFRAALTDFKDTVKPTWNTTSVYGRMDPIATFQRTERKINFSFDAVSENRDEAAIQYKRLRLLQSYMYPTYTTSAEGFDILEAAPLIRIGFSNWTPRVISPGSKLGGWNPKGPQYAVPGQTTHGRLIAGPQIDTLYLLGYIDGDVSFAPDLKTPLFESRGTSKKYKYKAPLRGMTEATRLWPSKMSVSISFTVLHEEKVGWALDSEGKYNWRK